MNQEFNLALELDTSVRAHFLQGEEWLNFCEQGQLSRPLSYAGFEFRLALERLAIELLLRIRNGKFESEDQKYLHKVDNINNRIREIAGNQLEIDRKVDFMNLVMAKARIPFRIAKINLGQLAKHWHSCSDLCHISWTVVSKDTNFRESAYQMLVQTHEFLANTYKSVVTWFDLQEKLFVDLQTAFVSGEIGVDEVEQKLDETGVWGLYIAPDGTKQFAHDLKLAEQ